MPYQLPLPARCAAEGWKVKIREKERNEPPHVTILRRTLCWRLSLRDGTFLIPPGGSWADIDRDVRTTLQLPQIWAALQATWDGKYPENPVGGDVD